MSPLYYDFAPVARREVCLLPTTPSVYSDSVKRGKFISSVQAATSIVLLLFGVSLLAQDVDPGRVTFENRCARCHGADGAGAEMGPPIARRLANLIDPQLTVLIRTGVPGRGMPPNPMEDADMAPLTRYLRLLQARAGNKPVVRKKAQLTDGKTLEGVVLNEGFDDLQLQTDDLRIHLLRGTGDRYREVTSQNDWPGYNGDPAGNRYTKISQITPANVGRLGPKWVFNLPNAPRLQVTPSVVDGIMYVAGPNECYALDAGTGRQIWHYQVPGHASSGGKGRRRR